MIYNVVIPAALLVAPWLVVRFVFVTPKSRRVTYKESSGFLGLAAALWVMALVVPNVPISPETTTFSMHMTGGAVAAVLFLYAVKVYGWTFAVWWQKWVGLFFFVSALGVVNELFELFLNQIGYPGMILGDERWDLLANTIGAFAAYGACQIAKRVPKPV